MATRETARLNPATSHSPTRLRSSILRLTNVVDVTSFVQAQYGTASPFAGFQLRELVQIEVTQFASNDDPNKQLRPHLDINYTAAVVPEPSTFGLTALGLVGLGCVALRKQYRATNAQRPCNS